MQLRTMRIVHADYCPGQLGVQSYRRGGTLKIISRYASNVPDVSIFVSWNRLKKQYSCWLVSGSC